MALTDKQKAFVAEYLVDLNATQAAIRAGYSAKTAYRIGAQLLQKTSVAEAIQQAQVQREKRTLITADRVLTELARIAFGDVRAVVDWGPDGLVLRDSSELTDDEAATVAEVHESVTKDGGSKRVKQHDKIKALDLLGRHLGMWEKREIPIGDGEITKIRVVVEDGRIARDADVGRIARDVGSKAEESHADDTSNHTPEQPPS